VPRNSLHGSGAATLDLRWSREFAVHPSDKKGVNVVEDVHTRDHIHSLFAVHPSDKKGVNVVPGVDVFNLLNRANYTSFVGNLSSPFFGHPVSAAPARRIQISFTVKF